MKNQEGGFHKRENKEISDIFPLVNYINQLTVECCQLPNLIKIMPRSALKHKLDKYKTTCLSLIRGFAEKLKARQFFIKFPKAK